MDWDFLDVGRVDADPDGGTRVEAEKEEPNFKHPPVVSSLNIALVRAIVARFDVEIEAAEVEARAFEVESDATAREAVERAGRIKGIVKRIEDRRKELIAEPDSYVRQTNQAVKPRRDRLDAIERIYKQKISDHAYREELKRREVERKQIEDRAKLQAAIDAEAKAAGVESMVVAPVAVPAKAGPTRSETATASAVAVWSFEVVDPKAVPRQYLTVDEAAIRAAVRGGIREIAGVRIFEEMQTRIRRVG